MELSQDAVIIQNASLPLSNRGSIIFMDYTKYEKEKKKQHKNGELKEIYSLKPLSIHP
jgi:hypothetical protein